MAIDAFIPESIQGILHRLEHHHHKAYLVGGCVRDILMGRNPQDWDICTDALPEEVLLLFPDSLQYGMKHGTVTVRWEDALAEVTTFRAESGYSDHRRPDHVTFIRDLNQDLARRDFTVNAIAVDASGQIHDPFDGQDDISSSVLRTVGDAPTRFHEDALRMLRAVRFSAQLGFNIENKTMEGIRACVPLVSELAPERVSNEIEKTLLSGRPSQVSLMVDLGLLKPWGITKLTEDTDRLQMIQSDRAQRWMGFSVIIDGFEEALHALRIDNKTVKACKVCNEIKGITPCNEIEWKYVMERYGLENTLQSAFVLSAMYELDVLTELQRIMERGDCLSVQTLAINGNDVASLGVHGEIIGKALQFALHHVFEFPNHNEKSILLQLLAKEFINYE